MQCLDMWGNGCRNPLERTPRMSTALPSALTNRDWEQWHGSAFFLPILGGQMLLAGFSLWKLKGRAAGPAPMPGLQEASLQAAQDISCRVTPQPGSLGRLVTMCVQQDCTLWIVGMAIRSSPQHGNMVIASCEPKDGFSLTNFRLRFAHCAKVCIGPIYSEKWGWQDNRGTTIRAN